MKVCPYSFGISRHFLSYFRGVDATVVSESARRLAGTLLSQWPASIARSLKDWTKVEGMRKSRGKTSPQYLPRKASRLAILITLRSQGQGKGAHFSPSLDILVANDSQSKTNTPGLNPRGYACQAAQRCNVTGETWFIPQLGCNSVARIESHRKSYL
ncbi:hypothetical protein PoB_004644600 [Plakobranchus ocellatus]|uniref:Uncharacterized protein n=1 Tax=Plakobranchus ocellatus TaxID=259542 RepID=A0AAV4BHM0_9GAST|nr:hypothetical protein PoB_004644600 [Plakobranchus ocellatus]